jgi:hypothetical protein
MSNPIRPLRLFAKDETDLKIMASCLQDAIIPVGDIAWLKSKKEFALAFNRFMWEASEEVLDNSPIYFRTHTLLKIENVINVQSRSLNLQNRSEILSMLSLKAFDGGVDLLFSEDKAIRVQVEKLNLVLTDMGQPWPTRWQPNHPKENSA